MTDKILTVLRKGSLESQVHHLQQLVNERQTQDSIRSKAHSIKGASLGACFEIMADLAQKVEHMEPFDWKTAADISNALAEEYAIVKQLI